MEHVRLLTHAYDRLAQCKTVQERWVCGMALLADCGSEWLTAGTASSETYGALAIRSSTSAALMLDYLNERLHLEDPWMEHCATSTEVEICDSASSEIPHPTKAPAKLSRLFADHGVHRALLLPSYGGARTGGMVLYARSADTAAWLSTPKGWNTARLLTAILSAHYRPDEDTSPTDKPYADASPLSAREREVLLWLAAGNHTAMIASRMGIEPVTVSKHLATARRKLGARTREQALAIAVRDRLIAI